MKKIEINTDKLLNEVSDIEKFALIEFRNKIWIEITYPANSQLPGPSWTQTVLLNAIASAYLAGKDSTPNG